MLSFCMDAKQLRRALADIERAEANGFAHCLAVCDIRAVGHMLGDVRAEYSDLIERASDTDRRLDWGRFQRVTWRYRFVDGALVPLTIPEA